MKRLLLLGFLVVGLFAAGGATGFYFWQRHHARDRDDALIASGNYNAARVLILNEIKADPRNPEPHVRLADVLMKLADAASAERELRSAARLGATRAALIEPLGQALIAQGMFRETLSQVQPVGLSTDATLKVLTVRSIAQLALGDLPAAERTLAETRSLAPESAEASLIAARLAAAHGEAEQTERLVDAVLASDPQQLDALLMKGQLLATRNDRPQAMALFRRAVQVAPWSAMARTDLAKQLVYAGEDAEAQQDIDAVLRVQPRFIDATFMNAVLMLRRGKVAESMAELQRLAPAASNLPQIVYYQAVCALRLGQLEQAGAFAERYNKMAPADPDGMKLLAEAWLQLKRPAQVVALLEPVPGVQQDPDALALLARAYAASGRANQASGTVGRAARLTPADPMVQSSVGTAELKLGNAQGAVPILEQAAAASPTVGTRESLATALLSTGRLDEAATVIDGLKAEDGKSETVRVLDGVLRMGRGDLAGAKVTFSDLVRDYPESVAARLNLAKLQLQLGERASAMAMMADILKTSPADVAVLAVYIPLLERDRQVPTILATLRAAHQADPRQAGTTALLGEALIGSGMGAEAVKMVRDTGPVQAMPNVLRRVLARAQSSAGDLDGARRTYSEALAAEPGNLDMRSALVEMALNAKDATEAVRLLKDGLVRDPGNVRIMTAWLAIVQQGQGIDAAMALARTMEAEPANMPNAAAMPGDVLTRAGRRREAAELYRTAYAAQPSAALAQRLAAALAATGQDTEATSVLQGWLAAHPDSPAAAQALAQLEIKANSYAEAKQHLEMVLAQRPNDPLALNNLAWVYLALGDPRMVEVARHAYLLTPGATTGDTLAWMLVKAGAAKAGLPLLQDAKAERPADPTIAYHLAVALKDDGQRREALATLQPLLQDGVAFPEKEDARRLLAEISG